MAAAVSLRHVCLQLRPEPTITVDGEELGGWSYGRTGRRVLRRLFGIIVNSRAGLRRDELVDRLWPDSDGDRAVRNLYSATNDLRHVLSAVPGIELVVHDGCYSLRWDANVTVKI